MKLEKIQELWCEDSKIDQNQLGSAALEISQLHSKYYSIYIHEKMLLMTYDVELKKLKADKLDFFTLGETKHTRSLGWVHPGKNMSRTEAQTKIEIDEDIIQSTLKYGLQKEKVDFLKSIIDSFQSRGYNIKCAVDYMRFQTGGY